MENRTTYLSVGLFLFLGVLALLYITLTLGDSELVDDEHYQLTARFVSASGLLLRGLPGVPTARADPIPTWSTATKLSKQNRQLIWKS